MRQACLLLILAWNSRADLRSRHIEGYIQDNSGDNISAKNKMYCELTAQYWAWKNLDADYYGFFHYRRYLNFSENKYSLDSWQNITEERLNDTCLKKYNLNDDCIRNLVETYDLVLSEEKNVAKMPDRNASVYEQYKNGRSLNIRDLDLVRDIIAAKHPDYLDTFDEVMKGRKTCLCNMYIMKKELFHEYMSWLFDILFEFEKKADMSEYTVEGYMFGADDYVTKPFNVKVLIARCNNLIKNKKRLIAHYAGKTITESPVTEAINERDKELLAKCVNIIKENFENPAFDVTALASELCVGRSKLYMQFKQMTGLTPNEFILKIKLDEAMSLLKNHPELNISEISIRLGFSSPRYFSKSFKAFFGVAPQTVRSRKKE